MSAVTCQSLSVDVIGIVKEVGRLDEITSKAGRTVGFPPSVLHYFLISRTGAKAGSYTRGQITVFRQAYALGKASRNVRCRRPSCDCFQRGQGLRFRR